jgi:predicted enzyme related to lactoylglutathione lyase
MSSIFLGISWAGIYVDDLDAAVEFYQRTVGLPLVRTRPEYAHFDAGSGNLLELFSGGDSSSGPKDPTQQSVVVALQVDDLAAAEKVLRRRGVRFTDNKGTFANSSWATFVDLEGNLAEIKEIR